MSFNKLVILVILVEVNFYCECIGTQNVFKNINSFLFDANENAEDANENFEFIDLTHYPQEEQFCNIGQPSWFMSNEQLFNRGKCGTYMDSKYYIHSKGDYVDEIPLTKLIVPMIIADVSSQVHDDPNFVLYKYNLDYFINNYFGFNQPCVVIFKFGWSKYYRDPKTYFGIRDKDDSHHKYPGISEEVAKWIVSTYKNVVGVGVDSPSVDAGSSNSSIVHETLLKAGLYVIENVKLDHYLPDAWCTAVVLPMKLGKTVTAPVRLIAICPKSRMHPMLSTD